LPPEKYLGPVDPATVEKVKEDEEKPADIQGIPPIHQVINIDDFEAQCSLPPTNFRKFHRETHLPEPGPIIPLPQTINFVLPRRT